MKVLDHGYIKLVNSMGNDLSIVNAARISYDQRTSKLTPKDERLIRRLMMDDHTSPFEAVEFQFEVKAPIFVLRQWQRHRTWSYNEVSGRYVDLGEPEFYIPEADNIGVQSKDNKQGRTVPEFSMRNFTRAKIQGACASMAGHYREMIMDDVPRELARMVLPLNTYTTMVAKVNLRNLLHFLHLRLDEHAQWEIRQYAEAIYQLIMPIVPSTLLAWNEKHGR